MAFVPPKPRKTPVQQRIHWDPDEIDPGVLRVIRTHLGDPSIEKKSVEGILNFQAICAEADCLAEALAEEGVRDLEELALLLGKARDRIHVMMRERNAKNGM